MRTGEANTFERLIEAHQSMVFSIALRMLGQRGEAEEVAQDVFLELHDVRNRLDGDEHARAG